MLEYSVTLVLENVLFIVSQSTAGLSRRSLQLPGISCDTSGAQWHHNRTPVFAACVFHRFPLYTSILTIYVTSWYLWWKRAVFSVRYELKSSCTQLYFAMHASYAAFQKLTLKSSPQHICLSMMKISSKCRSPNLKTRPKCSVSFLWCTFPVIKFPSRYLPCFPTPYRVFSPPLPEGQAGTA
jgi:hypothetical protein